MELMEQTNQAAFSRALDAATEEAVNEFDSVDVDDVEVEEELSSDEAELSDEVVDDDSSEEEAFEAESDEDEAEEEPALSMVEWNGNPDELPSHIEHDGKVYDLTKTYKAMQAGFTKKMQEVAETRKQYEELTRQYQQELAKARQDTAAKANPRPANPTEDMTPEQQEKRWDEIQAWSAEQAYMRMVQDGKIPDPELVKAQMAEQEQQAAHQRRINLLYSQPGWSETVESNMIELAQSDPYWQQALQSDDGALALMRHVQQRIDYADLKKKAAELENAKVKRNANASKRATPMPNSSKQVKSKPADRFADLGFEERIDLAISEGLDI
jgi:hypothetical protein